MRCVLLPAKLPSLSEESDLQFLHPFVKLRWLNRMLGSKNCVPFTPHLVHVEISTAKYLPAKNELSSLLTCEEPTIQTIDLSVAIFYRILACQNGKHVS